MNAIFYFMWGIILRVISLVACPLFGCVCDDIEISIEDVKIVRNKNGCVLSNAKFLNFNEDHRIQSLR